MVHSQRLKRCIMTLNRDAAADDDAVPDLEQRPPTPRLVRRLFPNVR